VLKLQNYQYGEQTWYVSSEIMSNWEQYFDVNSLRTVLEEIKKLSGIKDIKEDAKLSGNQILVVPLVLGLSLRLSARRSVPLPILASSTTATTYGAPGVLLV
jgi:hypothetical protein